MKWTATCTNRSKFGMNCSSNFKNLKWVCSLVCLSDQLVSHSSLEKCQRSTTIPPARLQCPGRGQNAEETGKLVTRMWGAPSASCWRISREKSWTSVHHECQWKGNCWLPCPAKRGLRQGERTRARCSQSKPWDGGRAVSVWTYAFQAAQTTSTGTIVGRTPQKFKQPVGATPRRVREQRSTQLMPYETWSF